MVERRTNEDIPASLYTYVLGGVGLIQNLENEFQTPSVGSRRIAIISWLVDTNPVEHKRKLVRSHLL